MSLLAVSWHFCSGTHIYLALALVDSTHIHLHIKSPWPGYWRKSWQEYWKLLFGGYKNIYFIIQAPLDQHINNPFWGWRKMKRRIEWSFVIIFLLTNHADVDNINIRNVSTESVVIGQCQQGGYLMIASSHWSILFYSCDTGRTGGEGVIHLC